MLLLLKITDIFFFLLISETIDHIQVGSFYELDHSKLPPTTSEEMKSIRVVMVNEKSLFKVSVRFPSLHSLQTHMNEESYQNLDGFLPFTLSISIFSSPTIVPAE
ncbi:hypothetical protein RchiOBHm_Chr2g0100881 [Rosa chinensis]|uniref:Uncharacterized protein n=1 Tax=Rosa chinensis TaxID=74649 RepID=A0A2P6RM85_ROSCH|nr:hypothetical protein RchiOBHm_Chr2g0100881 [Rosa chinensis]